MIKPNQRSLEGVYEWSRCVCPRRHRIHWVLAVSKRFAAEVWDEAGLRCELLFPAFDYARIAAISGWMPMMATVPSSF